MGNLEKPFFHECRALGLVFQTFDDWYKWLEANKHEVNKSVSEHFGFKYNINDVCINPHVKASYKMDNYNYFEVRTARTQYGWVYGYSVNLYSEGSSSPACYPSRYSKNPFFETENDAIVDGLSFVIKQLECKKKTKTSSMLLYYAKKQRMEIKHPQLDLFSNQQF